MRNLMKMLAIWAFFFSALSILPISLNAQDRTTIDRQVKFLKGKDSASIKNRIFKGTAHQYRVSGKAGQGLQIDLKAKGRISFTLYSPTQGIIEDADGVKSWNGELPDDGEYLILIGTDINTRYLLEIAFK